jgi:pimeloyl-ACP methyl ester carboxylesterase
MSNTIFFIHGAWMTPRCWEPFIGYFEQQGYICKAPAWPHKDLPFDELRSHPPAELATLGVTEIVDHYTSLIQAQPEPPILIGHSFGGLFVQMLLDRGLGRAGVAIDPAPPKGVLSLEWSVLRSNASILFKWMAWEQIVSLSYDDFCYAFVHTLPPEAQWTAYDSQVVPESGRIFFQDALAEIDPHEAVKVNFNNLERAPLLLIAGLEDHLVPPAVVRSIYEKYPRTPMRTDLLEFPERTHWIIAQDGWDEVAASISSWLTERAGVSKPL